MKKLIIVILCFICLSGCSNSDSSDNGMVSYMEAKEKIINEGAILVDVRTEDEYNENHIDGAILFTLDTINEDTAINTFDSKDEVIILYCKSGNRSHQAYEKLKDLGYTEVYDLGSINNWEK